MLIQQFNILFWRGRRPATGVGTGSNNLSWPCLLWSFTPALQLYHVSQLYPSFCNCISFCNWTPILPLYPVSQLYLGAVRRNVRVRYDGMYGFGAWKYADMVRQNVVGMVWRNVRVWCVKVCGYAAKCRNDVTECGCDGMATKWRPRATTDRQNRIIFANSCDFYLENAFKSVALISTIENWN